MKIVNWVAYVLLVIGGLNWGLVGLFDYDLVKEVLGFASWLQQLVYILVGVSALLALVYLRPVEKKASVVQPVV